MTRTFDDSRPDDFQGTYNPNSSKRTLLLPNPTATASARPTIAHSQLRHLISCPQRRGIVYYVGGSSIVERDLLHPHLPARNVINLDFPPTCFAATTIASNPHAILFAAGGQHSQLHVSLHSFSPITTSPPPYSTSTTTTTSSSSSFTPPPPAPKLLWKHDGTRYGEPQEIVNTIMFTQTSLTDDTRRPGSPTSDFRMAVGGNNRAVRFYDIVLQANTKEGQRMQLCGQVILETCVNHASISPNGRTLLCVGDTSKVYLYHLSPGTNVTFLPIAVYDLPRPPPHPLSFTLSPTIPPSNFKSIACFSSAWSPDGLKFAVGSQEGQLCVWDVRSALPIFQYWTPYRVNHKWKEFQWESVNTGSNVTPLEENGPDSGIRSVRFTGGESGRELLIWVEQTVNVHVIDARTFDSATHGIIPFPNLSHLDPPQDLTLPISPSGSPPPLAELSPDSSTDSLVEDDSSRTTTETGTGAGTTSTVTNTTAAALSRRVEARGARVRTRTPSPPSPSPLPSSLPPPPLPPPLPPLGPVSASPPTSSAFENNDTWWPGTPASRQSPAPHSSNIFHILRAPGDYHRRRERLQRQRSLIMEQLQRDGSGSSVQQPQQQQQQQRRDSPNNANDSSGGVGGGGSGTRSIPMRRDYDDVLRQSLISSRNMQALLPASSRAEISAEIRSLIDDTRARIAALNGNGNGNNRGGGGREGGGGERGERGELPQPLRSLVGELEDEIVINHMSSSSGGDDDGGGGRGEGPVQISGLCLDPTGGWVYVAGSTGIVEWRVREREEGKGGASGGWV